MALESWLGSARVGQGDGQGLEVEMQTFLKVWP